MIEKEKLRIWVDDSVGKVLALKTIGFEFGSQNPHKKAGHSRCGGIHLQSHHWEAETRQCWLG